MAHIPYTKDKSSHRPARFAELIKEELIGLVPAEIKDPRLEKVATIIVTDVAVAGDLKNATVSFSLSEDEEKYAPEVAKVLNQAANFLRREISYTLASKITPQLHFKFNRGPSNVSHIDKLLKEAQPSPVETGTDESNDHSDDE